MVKFSVYLNRHVFVMFSETNYFLLMPNYEPLVHDGGSGTQVLPQHVTWGPPIRLCPSIQLTQTVLQGLVSAEDKIPAGTVRMGQSVKNVNTVFTQGIRADRPEQTA